MSVHDDEPLQSDDPLCECSYEPDQPVTPDALARSLHTRSKHRAKGAARCLGRDPDGRACECPSFTPLGGHHGP